MAHRATVVENGGKPYTLSTKYVDCTGLSLDSFSQVSQELLLSEEPAEGQAPWSRGQVLVSGTVGAFSGVDVLALEVNVIGVVGGVPDVIARCVFGQNRIAARVEIDKPYDKIVFEARRSATIGDSQPQVRTMGFTAVGRFWR